MIKRGPQSDRERKWIGKSQEIVGAERDDLAVEHEAEKQIYESELSRLRRENASLKEHLQRCMREIKAYQLKYPSAHVPAHPIEGDSLPPWLTSTEITTPLFDSYDARISELEELVKHQSTQMNGFQQKVEQLLLENDHLRAAQLESLRQTATSTMQDDNSKSAFGVFSPLGAELLNELNERTEILMSENALMVEQKAILLSELEGFQDELNKSHQEISEIKQQYANVVKDLHATRARASQSESDRDEAASQIHRYSESLGKAQGESDELKEQLEVWQQKCDTADKNMTEAKKQLKAMSNKLDEDGLVAMRRVKIAEDRVRELHTQLLQKSQELETSNEVVRKLRREYQSTRQDAEGMLQVMSGLERQLSEYASREEEVDKTTKANKEKLEEALVIRDQAISREEQNRREVERLLEEKKRLALQRQNDIEEAVEHTKTMILAQVRSVESALSEATGRNASLRADAEKYFRESRSYKELSDRLQRLLESERESALVEVKNLEDNLTASKVGREKQEGTLRLAQDLNKDYRQIIDKLRTQLEMNRQQTEEKDKSRDKELIALRGIYRDSQREWEDKLQGVMRTKDELEEQLSVTQSQLSEAEKRMEEEAVTHRRKVMEMEQLVREHELIYAAEEKRSKQTLDVEREQWTALQSSLTARLKEEKENAIRLSARVRQLEQSIISLTGEKDTTQKSLETQLTQCHQLRQKVEEMKTIERELRDQLAKSFEARQKASRSNTRTFLNSLLKGSASYSGSGSATSSATRLGLNKKSSKDSLRSMKSTPTVNDDEEEEDDDDDEEEEAELGRKNETDNDYEIVDDPPLAFTGKDGNINDNNDIRFDDNDEEDYEYPPRETKTNPYFLEEDEQVDDNDIDEISVEM